MATPLPINDAPFSLGDLLAATGGQLISPRNDLELNVRGISTDTRTLSPGQAFVALAGERYDGHRHLQQAAAAGASLAVVEKSTETLSGIAVLRVPSTLAALGAMASHHLGRWRRQGANRRVLALTGSAGKTTTKVVLASMLCGLAPGQVFASPGNLNNLIGVPLTVLSLSSAHRYAVLELGTNQPGEIDRLAAMVRPDLALITLIAAAHCAGLGSIEQIAAEKTALFRRLSPQSGIAIGNADDPRVYAALNECDANRRIGYGQGELADYRIVARHLPRLGAATVELSRPDRSGLTCELPLLGKAGALAFAGAVAATEALLATALDAPSVQRALVSASLDAVAGRLQLLQLTDGLLLIDDSYNANPASMAASLSAASEIAAQQGRKLVLVLGEMCELGAAAEAAHDTVGQLAADTAARLVITVGGAAEMISIRTAAAGMESHFVDTAPPAAELAVARVTADDLVLVKGSRSVFTEQVVKALVTAHGPVLGHSSATGLPAAKDEPAEGAA